MLSKPRPARKHRLNTSASLGNTRSLLREKTRYAALHASGPASALPVSTPVTDVVCSPHAGKSFESTAATRTQKTEKIGRITCNLACNTGQTGLRGSAWRWCPALRGHVPIWNVHSSSSKVLKAQHQKTGIIQWIPGHTTPRGIHMANIRLTAASGRQLHKSSCPASHLGATCHAAGCMSTVQCSQRQTGNMSGTCHTAGGENVQHHCKCSRSVANTCQTAMWYNRQGLQTNR